MGDLVGLLVRAASRDSGSTDAIKKDHHPFRDRVSIAKTLSVAPNCGLGKCWAGVTVFIV